MELLNRQETWNITYTHALGETAIMPRSTVDAMASRGVCWCHPAPSPTRLWNLPPSGSRWGPAIALRLSTSFTTS